MAIITTSPFVPNGSKLLSNQPVSFDVTTDDGSLVTSLISVQFGSDPVEVVWNGGAFSVNYAALSTRTPITNGFRYILARTGGWQPSPSFSAVSVSGPTLSPLVMGLAGTKIVMTRDDGVGGGGIHNAVTFWRSGMVALDTAQSVGDVGLPVFAVPNGAGYAILDNIASPVLLMSMTGANVVQYGDTAYPTILRGLTVGLITSKKFLAGANEIIGTVSDKLNPVHLAIVGQVIGDLLYADSGTTFARRAAGIAGQVLTANGAGVAPTWQAPGNSGPVTRPGAYPYTILAADACVLVDCTAPHGVVLDSTLPNGHEITIVTRGTTVVGASANPVTITASGGFTVVGPPGAALINIDQDKRKFKLDTVDSCWRQI